MVRERAILAVLLGLVALFAASAAEAKCEQMRVGSRQFRLIGPPGATCTLLLPLRFVNDNNIGVEHLSATVETAPEKGRVTIREDRAARTLNVVFAPSSRAPIEDRFVITRCIVGPRGEACNSITVDVRYSEQMAQRARTFCRPQPFAMRTDQPVQVSMSGTTGDRCAIRLFRSDKPMRLWIEQSPAHGRAWIEQSTVFFISRTFGTDRFRVRACPDGDTMGACSILDVTVEQL